MQVPQGGVLQVARVQRDTNFRAPVTGVRATTGTEQTWIFADFGVLDERALLQGRGLADSVRAEGPRRGCIYRFMNELRKRAVVASGCPVRPRSARSAKLT